MLARILCGLPNMWLVVLTLLLMPSHVVTHRYSDVRHQQHEKTRYQLGIPVDELTADIRRYAELAISPSTRPSCTWSTGAQIPFRNPHCCGGSSKESAGCTVQESFGSSPEVCPVIAMTAYFANSPARPTDHLFTYSSGVPVRCVFR